MSDKTYVYFGNESVTQFEASVGIKLSDEDRAFLEQHHQESAQHIAPDKFHIFKAPFAIHCGTAIFNEVLAILRKHADEYTKRFTLEQIIE